MRTRRCLVALMMVVVGSGLAVLAGAEPASAYPCYEDGSATINSGVSKLQVTVTYCPDNVDYYISGRLEDTACDNRAAYGYIVPEEGSSKTVSALNCGSVTSFGYWVGGLPFWVDISTRACNSWGCSSSANTRIT